MNIWAPCEGKKGKGIINQEFPCGLAGWGSGIVTAVTQVTSVAWVQSPAWELPHATGMAKKGRKEGRQREREKERKKRRGKNYEMEGLVECKEENLKMEFSS